MGMGQWIRHVLACVMVCCLAGCQVAGLPAAPERAGSGSSPSALLKPETGQRDLLAGPAHMLFQQQGRSLALNALPAYLSQSLNVKAGSENKACSPADLFEICLKTQGTLLRLDTEFENRSRA
ncbi:MAG: hypothetical protein CVV27_08750 [Candidatus Melainabacteria bacterium HGW-Melainabacteria-1]|nr:MAG: hypothetical protein CVV27_08750 [Candidatus Melainabacteria bacterium HGW-Melainabacteria-1]